MGGFTSMGGNELPSPGLGSLQFYLRFSRPMLARRVTSYMKVRTDETCVRPGSSR